MRKVTDVAGYFWDHVQKSDGCWEWIGQRHVKGYGNPHLRGSTNKAHRMSWELHNGPIPDGLHVLHHCDNPPCVRPDHLFLGTDRDNLLDSMTKGRRDHLLGSRLPMQVCETCGRLFRITARTRPRRFCSRTCIRTSAAVR